MPAGTYRLLDDGREIALEEFRCAPGPAGWRYVSTIHATLPEPHVEIVDLAVDGRWRPARVRIDTGSHDVLLNADNGKLRGIRDSEPVELEWQDDIDYLSPAFNVATANRLRRTADVSPVWLEPVTLEPRIDPQRYELLGEEEVDTPVGRFTATAWRYTALRSGFSARVWIAGDVVVSYEGVYELAHYEPGGGAVPR